MTKNIKLDIRGMSKEDALAAKKALFDLGWKCVHEYAFGSPDNSFEDNIRYMAFACDISTVLDIPNDLKDRISDFIP